MSDLFALVPVVEVSLQSEAVMEDGEDRFEDEVNDLWWLLVTLQLGVGRRVQLVHIVSQLHQHQAVKHDPCPVVVTLLFSLCNRRVTHVMWLVQIIT